MKVTRINKLMIAGISTLTNNSNEFNEESAKIPALWDEYVEQKIDGQTFNKANNGYMFGVYSDYASDMDGDYKYTLGIEVTKPKKALVIEDERYLVFDKKGELPDTVIETWQEIWSYFKSPECIYERAYKVDFEKYVKEDEIEIYISIK